LDNGRVIWVLAKLDAGFDICLEGGLQDRTDMYCLMSSGYKSGFALQIDLTSVRVVCMNTLRMARNAAAKEGARYRHVHNTAWDESKKQAAINMIEAAHQAAEDYHEAAEILAAAKVPYAITEAFTVELMQPRLLDEIKGRIALEAMIDGGMDDATRDLKLGAAMLNAIAGGKETLDSEKFSQPVKQILKCVDRQPGAHATAGTLWGDLQAVTYFTDHIRGNSVQTRLQSAWYGDSAQVKSSALDLALSYTERMAHV
jgi:hypothetical protein